MFTPDLPVVVPLFQVVNFMQSETSEYSPVPLPNQPELGLAVWPGSPHCPVCRRQVQLPTRYCRLILTCFFHCCRGKKGIDAKFLWPGALHVASQQESLDGAYSFSVH